MYELNEFDKILIKIMKKDWMFFNKINVRHVPYLKYQKIAYPHKSIIKY